MLKVNVWFMTTDALPVTVEIDDGGPSFSDEIEKQDYVLDYLINQVEFLKIGKLLKYLMLFLIFHHQLYLLKQRINLLPHQNYHTTTSQLRVHIKLLRIINYHLQVLIFHLYLKSFLHSQTMFIKSLNKVH